MGWLTDKLGPRFVVVTMGSFLGVCYLLMSQVQTLWQFSLNFILVGSIGVSTLNVPVMVTLSRWFVKRRGTMMGIVQAGSGIGGLIFPPLVGWLILTSGWRTAYVVLGMIALGGMITAGLLLRNDPKAMGLSPDGEAIACRSRNGRGIPAEERAGVVLWRGGSNQSVLDHRRDSTAASVSADRRLQPIFQPTFRTSGSLLPPARTSWQS